MPNVSAPDAALQSLRTKLRLLACSNAALFVLLVALAGAFIYRSIISPPAPVQAVAKASVPNGTIVLRSKKTGTRLVLSGSGIRLLSPQGHLLGSFSTSHAFSYYYATSLTVTDWEEPTKKDYDDYAAMMAKTSATAPNRSLLADLKPPSQPKEDGRIQIASSGLRMFMGASTNAVASLAEGLGDVYLSLNPTSSPKSSLLLSGNAGIRVFGCYKKQCTHTADTEISAGSLRIKDCISGKDASDTKKVGSKKNCAHAIVGSPPLPGMGGPTMAFMLADNKMLRVAIGNVGLTRTDVGGSEVTPLSSVVLFNKKGDVTNQLGH